MQRSHFLILSGITICSLFLTWCWRISSQEVQVTFDKQFSIYLPETFKSVPSQVVENKQLINKIVAAYKVNTTEGFDNNLIISKSALWPQLDVDQFRTLQSKKMQRLLVWYEPQSKQQISFSCNDQKINWLYVTFNLNDTSNIPAATYYLAQYQYLYQGTWYILSYISATEDDRNSIKSAITTITCISPTP